MGSFLKRLYRTPSEFQELGTARDKLVKMSVIGVSLLGILLLFTGFFSREAASWLANSSPTVAIAPESWQVTYGAAAPDWSRSILRHSPAHLASRRNHVLTEYWIRTVVPNSVLREALAKSANTLALGWFRGKHEIRINGKVALRNDAENTTPISIFLDERALNAQSLEIVIYLEKSPRHQFADLMNIATPTGFYDAAHLNAYFGFHSFWSRVRPLAYFILNLAIALFFFAVWLHFPGKGEHYYLALFALANSLAQLRLIDFVFLRFGFEQMAVFDYLVKTSIAITGFLLGAALARLRRVLMKWAAIGMSCAAIAALPLFGNEHNIRSFGAVANNILIGLGLALGALLCLLQIIYLTRRFGLKSASKTRIRTLLFSSLGLLTLAAIYWHKTSLETYSLETNYGLVSHMAAHVGILFYLAFVLLHEIKQQTLLVEKTPVSIYHKRAVLPDKLFGAILTIDMKDSESLYRLNTASPTNDNWVGLWRSHAYLLIARLDGTVLQKRGDEIQIFFDSDRHANAERAALACFRELVTVSRQLETTLATHDHVGDNQLHFRIRGSLVSGEIKPIWENMGKGIQEPYWEQVRGSNPFVDAARLLDAEKQLVIDKTVDALTMTKETARAVGVSEGGSWLSSVAIQVKSSPLYEVTAFLPGIVVRHEEGVIKNAS